MNDKNHPQTNMATFLGQKVCIANQSKWQTTWILVALLSFSFLFPSLAMGKTKIKLRGYAETRYTAMLGLDFGKLCEGDIAEAMKSMCNPHILTNRLRPSALVHFSRKARIRITGNLFTSHFRSNREVKEIGDILTLARFYLELREPRIKIRIGKQSFSWGPAQLWSLTTPFVPQNPTNLNAVLPGLWSVSADISYAQTGFFKIGVMASPDFQYTLEFLRWKHTFGNTDVALTVVEGGLKRELVFGAEVKGTLILGFWVEAAARIPYEELDLEKDGKDPTFSFVLGFDYSFPVLESMIVSVQYYYNHAGEIDPEKYPFNTTEGLIALGQQANNTTGMGLSSGGFIGRHYLMLMVQLQIFEELSGSVMMLGNLIDPSFLVGPFVSWTFLDNFTLTTGAYFLLGPQGSEFAPGKIKLPIPGAPEDGVTLSPVAMVFAWLRYSF